MDSRRYTLRTLMLLLGLVSTIGAINWTVDPYGALGRNRLGVYISAEREAKPLLLRRYSHNALLVGNSKAAMIPVAELRGWRFFNGAFGGATLEETYSFLNRFATTQSLVLLAADPGLCDREPPTSDLFAPPSWSDRCNKVFSLKSLEYSIRTLTAHFRGESPHMAADGSFIARRWFELYDRPNPPDLRLKLDGLRAAWDAYHRPDGSRMEGWRRIAELLRQRRIPCAVFVPPLHEDLARYLQSSTNHTKLRAWKEELLRIFPQAHDFSMGAYSDAGGFFRSDPVHFKPQLGADMLNREILSPLLASPAALPGLVPGDVPGKGVRPPR